MADLQTSPACRPARLGNLMEAFPPFDPGSFTSKTDDERAQLNSSLWKIYQEFESLGLSTITPASASVLALLGSDLAWLLVEHSTIISSNAPSPHL